MRDPDCALQGVAEVNPWNEDADLYVAWPDGGTQALPVGCPWTGSILMSWLPQEVPKWGVGYKDEDDVARGTARGHAFLEAEI